MTLQANPESHPLRVPVALSARHVHLSVEHVKALFGAGHRLSAATPLSQPGQFAACETVQVVGPKRSIPNVRVLGPARGESQVELAVTDGINLGLNLPVRLSGDLTGSPGVHLIGSHGAVRLTQGAIVARRHLHLSREDGERLGWTTGQQVFVRLPGARGLILDGVTVRVGDYRTELHLDTDEGNAAGVRDGERVQVISDICRDLCGNAACPVRPGLLPGNTRPFCAFTDEEVTIR